MHVVNVFKTKLGSDHPDTLTSMSNLASTYWSQGRWDEAEKFEVDVMNTRKTRLGSDHPDTLTSMSNLASTYKNQGRWDDAVKLQVDVMNAFKTKLGSDHPDTLTGMSNLASTYGDQGRWDEAEKLEMDVMNTRKIKLGSDHPSTLSSMSNLASAYKNQGRWDEAEKLEMDVMNAFKAKLGPDHPSTLASMSNLALIYLKQERWDEAQRLLMEMLNEEGLNDAEELELDVINAKTVKPESGHLDATVTSITNQAPSTNQVLLTVQQDHNQPENMSKPLDQLSEIQQPEEQEPIIPSTFDHFKEVAHQVHEQGQDLVPMPSNPGEQQLEHIATQPKNKFIKGLKGIWRKLKC
ncbi:hypothetical protein F5887DRAFT_1079019 [Amanita rubescens]|nr:hypothetical protein F5887DRAFT_1079019 [Amanita rubescens]